MPKLLLRIVASFIIPCLIADPTLAAALSQQQPYVGKSDYTQMGLITEQALSIAVQEFRMPLESNRSFHHQQSKIGHVLSKLPFMTLGIPPFFFPHAPLAMFRAVIAQITPFMDGFLLISSIIMFPVFTLKGLVGPKGNRAPRFLKAASLAAVNTILSVVLGYWVVGGLYAVVVMIWVFHIFRWNKAQEEMESGTEPVAIVPIAGQPQMSQKGTSAGLQETLSDPWAQLSVGPQAGFRHMGMVAGIILPLEEVARALVKDGHFQGSISGGIDGHWHFISNLVENRDRQQLVVSLEEYLERDTSNVARPKGLILRIRSWDKNLGRPGSSIQGAVLPNRIFIYQAKGHSIVTNNINFDGEHLVKVVSHAISSGASSDDAISVGLGWLAGQGLLEGKVADTDAPALDLSEAQNGLFSFGIKGAKKMGFDELASQAANRAHYFLPNDVSLKRNDGEEAAHYVSRVLRVLNDAADHPKTPKTGQDVAPFYIISSSPRRADLTKENFCNVFRIYIPNVQEVTVGDPVEVVLQNSRLKAGAVGHDLHGRKGVAIAADTVVVLTKPDGTREALSSPISIVGPGDLKDNSYRDNVIEEARKMLRGFSGKKVQAYTAVTVINLETGKLETGISKTVLQWADLTEADIEVMAAKNLDAAGALRLQDEYDSKLVTAALADDTPMESVDYDSTIHTSMGLPINTAARLLSKAQDEKDPDPLHQAFIAISDATDGSQVTIEFPKHMTSEEINTKGLIEISLLANNLEPRKTFEVVSLASPEHPNVVIKVYQRIWQADPSSNLYDQVEQLVAKQNGITGANKRSPTGLQRYIRYFETGKTAYAVLYPDGSHKIFFGGIPAEDQKKAKKVIWMVGARADRPNRIEAGHRAPTKPRIGEDAPSVFDLTDIAGDPAEMALLSTASSGRVYAIMGNPFPLWPPKEKLAEGETQPLHFTVSRYASRKEDPLAYEKNAGAEGNQRDMAELFKNLNSGLRDRIPFWVVANGWYGSDKEGAPKAGPTQAHMHYQAGTFRLPVQNAEIQFTRTVGSVRVGTLKKDQGYGTAVVLEVPLDHVDELAPLGEQTVRLINAKGNTFNIVYTLTEDGKSLRAHYFDRPVGVPSGYTNEWAYSEISGAVTGDDVLRIFSLTAEQQESLAQIGPTDKAGFKRWVEEHIEELELNPNIWKEIDVAMEEVSAPDEEVATIADAIISRLPFDLTGLRFGDVTKDAMEAAIQSGRVETLDAYSAEHGKIPGLKSTPTTAISIVHEVNNQPAIYFLNEGNPDEGKVIRKELKPKAYQVFYVVKNLSGAGVQIYIGAALVEFLTETGHTDVLVKLIDRLSTNRPFSGSSADRLELLQLVSAIQYSVAYRWDKNLINGKRGKLYFPIDEDASRGRIVPVTYSDDPEEKDKKNPEENQAFPIKFPSAIDKGGVVQYDWLQKQDGEPFWISRSMVHNAWRMWGLVDHSVHLLTTVEGKIVVGRRGSKADIGQGTIDNFAGHSEFLNDRPETPKENALRELAEEYFGIKSDDFHSPKADFLHEALQSGELKLVQIGKDDGFANMRINVIRPDGSIFVVPMGKENSEDWGKQGHVFLMPFESSELFIVEMSPALALRHATKSVSDMEAAYTHLTLSELQERFAEGLNQPGPSLGKTLGNDKINDPTIAQDALNFLSKSAARFIGATYLEKKIPWLNAIIRTIWAFFDVTRTHENAHIKKMKSMLGSRASELPSTGFWDRVWRGKAEGIEGNALLAGMNANLWKGTITAVALIFSGQWNFYHLDGIVPIGTLYLTWYAVAHLAGWFLEVTSRDGDLKKFLDQNLYAAAA